MQFIGRSRPAAVGEALQFQFEVGKHPGIEQFSQFLGAEQITQQIAIECERGGPPLGQRSVAVVHVVGDPVEEKALREGRSLRRIDADHPHGTATELAEHLAQGRHVEHVLQALATGLEQDRKARVLGCDGEQIGCALALLPQRRAPVRPTPRQQQRAGRALTEPGREQRRLRERAHQQFIDVFRVDRQLVQREFVGSFGQADDDAVVAPHRLDRHVVAVDQPSLDRHRPRSVHRSAERRKDADPPITDLVAEPLDDDGAIVGHDARCLRLLAQVQHYVVGGELVERELGAKPLHRLRIADSPDLALERTERPAEFQWPPRPITVPERHLAGLTRRGRDDDAFECDVLDPPRGCAEQKGLAGP